MDTDKPPQYKRHTWPHRKFERFPARKAKVGRSSREGKRGCDGEPEGGGGAARMTIDMTPGPSLMRVGDPASYWGLGLE